ncbi:hemerythrin domain-containing protein [Tahibacter caeni]|uniref:hemerythrin domain-containing protein n=1 Tax=Tahibacter caeni TaxID=1453545 RepID=UPI002147B37D|nr:hemerythrin domain-containing protein [Tahibacter caeni]
MQASEKASASRSRTATAKKATSTAAKSTPKPKPATNADAAAAETDAGALLKRDHRLVEQLFAQYESLQSAQEKSELVRRICTELINHTRIEEELFYPACRAQNVDDDDLDEAQVEHDAAKILIRELLEGSPEDAYYDAKVSVLSEQIKHHVREEERPSTGIIAKATAAGVDMNELGRQVQARKQELTSAETRPGAPRPVSLHLALGDNIQEEHTMASQYRRERDEQGRFMSDDDDRYGSRGGGNRGGQSRDEYGRFESDDRGSGRYGRSHDDDDDRGSRGGGRGGQSRDEYGRFESDDRGSGRYSRSRDDDDRGYSRSSRDDDDRGRGWFGDPRGHAEAAREGWRNRDDDRSSRSRNDDDYSRSSRSRDDDDGRGRGHGGWFGDSRGHSEAAREGWRNRDDDRSSRSRSDDSSRSSRSRDDDDGRGHGGWFGDPRGHAEAARRGWQNR